MKSKPERKSTKYSFKTVILLLTSLWFGYIFLIFIFIPSARNIKQYIIDFSIKHNINIDFLFFITVIGLITSLYIVLLGSSGSRRAILDFLRITLKVERPFYLSDSLRSSERNSVSGDADDSFRRQMDEINAHIAELQFNIDDAEYVMSPEERDEIKKKLIERMEKSLSKSLDYEIKEFISYKDLTSRANDSLSRLSNQIEVLGSRANFSLWSGLAFCSLGLFILVIGFLWVSPMDGDSIISDHYWESIIVSLTPRLSLVLIIEGIGLFFLKLYRSTFEEIRITQNEITNIEMKIIALIASIDNCRDEVPASIRSLSNTERNFILQKGQSTTEIEKSKIEARISQLHGDLLRGLFSSRGDGA